MTMTLEATEATRSERVSDHSALHQSALLPPTEGYPWHSLPLDPERLTRYLGTCMAQGVGYELGAKADDLTAVPPDYHNIDCSGWVRAAVAVATDGKVILPDGSVVQNDWCAAQGLKRSEYAACRLADGLTRIAFIRASGFHPIGHVYLVRNGRTLESWGGHGPGSRPVTTPVLRAETTDVYVLAVRL
ncbi:MAG: hypothetical protein M3Y13_08770 [Armatimonadota bacterium]|nr:hypothetical protein [Armatimonadota bacterium]